MNKRGHWWLAVKLRYLYEESGIYYQKKLCVVSRSYFNTLRLRQNGHHFADDMCKYIFLNKNVWISIKISLNFVPKDPINTIPALVQIMAWRRPGTKPLSEPMMVSLLTPICVTRHQWVKFHCSLAVENSYKYLSCSLMISWHSRALTLLVLKLEYCGITRSISWRLTPCPLALTDR